MACTWQPLQPPPAPQPPWQKTDWPQTPHGQSPEWQSPQPQRGPASKQLPYPSHDTPVGSIAIGATVKASAPKPLPQQDNLFPMPQAAPVVPSAATLGYGGGQSLTTAFAILPTSSGPVLAPTGSVDGMLRADWALFLELAAYSLHGHMEGRLAFGIEEVAEAIKQAAVAVLFIPVSCGHGGESAVRGVAICGGRGYIVGSSHELYEDVDDWGAAAILHQPLARIKPPPFDSTDEEPAAKKPRAEGTNNNNFLVGAVGNASASAPLVKAPDEDFPNMDDATLGLTAKPEARERPLEKDLRRELKVLGRAESLNDKSSIPRTTESVRERYLPQLGGSPVFTAFADVFCRAKGIAHRKAMAYVIHELFMAKRGAAMRPEDRRLLCIEKFLLRIGKVVKGLPCEERQAYVKLLGAWQAARVLMPAELTQVKDAWDMD